MSGFYVYFISGLPMLHLGMPAPFDFERFLDNAPADVIEKFKSSHEELKVQRDRLRANLDSIE